MENEVRNTIPCLYDRSLSRLASTLSYLLSNKNRRERSEIQLHNTYVEKSELKLRSILLIFVITISRSPYFTLIV